MRGALHMNVVVASGTAREMASAAFYRHQLAEMAPRYGFGFVDRKNDVKSALHAARYIAKYFTEGTGKMGIGEAAQRDDAPAIIARVSRELTMQTRSTIRSCRDRRTVWNLASRLAPLDPATGCSIDEARLVRDRLAARRKLTRWETRARGHPPPLDWNAQLEAQRVEAEHEFRWLKFRLAVAGLAPTEIDD